jgi:hypothetical protein
MRSIHESPFSPLPTPVFHNVMMGFWLGMMLGQNNGIWGLACLLIALALGVWFLNRHRFGHGPFAKLIQVHRVVPWFFPSAVIMHPLDDTPSGEPDLRDTLLDHGIGIAEIDGTRISTWTDLARELEAAYGPMRYPSEARAKCSHILLAAQNKAPRPKVLIWRHAAQTLRINPALVVEFTTHWTATRISSWSPFLLLMDMPSAEEPQIERPSQPILRGKGKDDEEPAMADLAAAPSDSWWKPKPGEMTQ